MLAMLSYSADHGGGRGLLATPLKPCHFLSAQLPVLAGGVAVGGAAAGGASGPRETQLGAAAIVEAVVVS